MSRWRIVALALAASLTPSVVEVYKEYRETGDRTGLAIAAALVVAVAVLAGKEG